ncbi:hypothetical protein RMCBS344292_17009 [Rhizopus microsporus]|nr:hypothetical protein RMCBS344292_17009 [Rhizopus microsporus]
MRPPRGDIDDRIRYIVHQLGYVPAMWSVDSQDWRITAGGQTEQGLLANVTEWAKQLPTMKQGGNSLMHDLNNVTVGAAIKALPILHPHVQLSPVGTCAGWRNASYQENATNATGTPSVSASASIPASSAPVPTASSLQVTPAGSIAKGAASSASSVDQTIFMTAFTTLFLTFVSML